MKVLHIITGLNVGGAETMLARLMECAHTTPDIHHEIVSLMVPGAISARILATGIPIHNLGMRTGLPSLSAAIKLAKLARNIRPDLIMGWMHHGQIAATLAKLVAPGTTPMIWNVRHSLNGYKHEKPLTRVLLKAGSWLSGVPEAIVYNSRSACQQYRAFGYKPPHDIVIPNGFDRDAYSPRDEARQKLCALFGIPEQRLVIGMVARNHPMKDVPNLVNAFAHVLDTGLDAHLLIAGHEMDQPSEAVAQYLARLPSRSWALTGHRSDVASWLAGLDIAALPSAWGEGFPNIVGEAMACGVPCVATDVGDAAWAIGPTGLTVAPGNATAFAEALLDIASRGLKGREVLGDAARARVDAYFTLSSVAQRYATLFRENARMPSHCPSAMATPIAREAL